MKLNKKGFTLVELLAVIAILAILVVIAVPNVLGIFNESRVKAIKVDAQSIYEAAITEFGAAQLTSATAKTYSTVGDELNVSTNATYCIIINSSGVVTKFQYSNPSGYNVNMTSNSGISKSDIVTDANFKTGTLSITTCQ